MLGLLLAAVLALPGPCCQCVPRTCFIGRIPSCAPCRQVDPSYCADLQDDGPCRITTPVPTPGD